jgi:formylmethanofuran:tetrahydromethanopterin formyltransferase
MAQLVATALATSLLLVAALGAGAFTCPVVIKQAEELIQKAEKAKLSPDTRPLLEEAVKLLAEARAHHAKARTKRDHADAVRKAKVAIALAEEVLVLQTP